MAQPQPDRKPTYPEPPAYFEEALEDAERLLKYAAELGIPIEDDTRNHILQARMASSAGWEEESAANLLAALGKLAAKLKPVTAESLKAWGAKPKVTRQLILPILLAAIIVPFSLASFATTAISKKINADIVAANAFAVKLRAQFPPDAKGNVAASAGDSDTITELQQFAGLIRAIDGEARQLRVFVPRAEMDPNAAIRGNPDQIRATFQLPLGLKDVASAATDRTRVYLDVRYWGQSLVDDVAVFYDAFTACILPVLYALLGTCAYLARTFEQEISTRTYTPSVTNSARFLIAAIGGGVVGLFNNFTVGQGASIPPLAIAFLVGYAVDVFFAFLEGMLQTFTRSNTGSSAPPSATSAGA
jgi:hypothetical protein